jgi:hypothetical protein
MFTSALSVFPDFILKIETIKSGVTLCILLLNLELDYLPLN